MCLDYKGLLKASLSNTMSIIKAMDNLRQPNPGRFVNYPSVMKAGSPQQLESHN